MSSQATLRQQALLTRRQLSNQQVKQHSQQIVAQLIRQPELMQANVIAGYLPCNNEVDLTDLFTWGWQHNKTLLLPQCDTPEVGLLTWRHYAPDTPLIPNRYGIAEPDANHAKPCPTKHIDVVLTPLVAFDCQLHRIGMGGGYYDRTFASLNKRPTMLGCAFACQQVDSIPTNPWDIPLTAVITEQKVYN